MVSFISDTSELDDVLDVYSSSGENVGQEKRKIVHDNGLIHYAIHCWVWGEYNGELSVAFQKRKLSKRLFPGKYDVAAAGHYLSGEYGKDGLRELVEELGLPVSKYDVYFYNTQECKHIDKNVNNNELINVFFCHLSTQFQNIQFKNEEIDDIIIGSVYDFLQLLRGEINSVTAFSLQSKTNIVVSSNEFVEPYNAYYIQTLSALQNLSTSINEQKNNTKYYSFVMLKPDAIKRQLVSSIMNLFLSCGYTIDLFDVKACNDEDVYNHYAEKIAEEGDIYKTKAYKYFHGNYVVPIVIAHSSCNIITEVRKLVGYKDPKFAEKESIRGRWGIDSMEESEREVRCCENLIHACDSYDSFKRELMIWFKRKDVEKFLS